MSTTPKHPREFLHLGTRMANVDVKLHWSCGGLSGVTDYADLAVIDRETGHWTLGRYNWRGGNNSCDCNRANYLELTPEQAPWLFVEDDDGQKYVPCGEKIRISKVESLDPLVSSLVVDE